MLARERGDVLLDPPSSFGHFPGAAGTNRTLGHFSGGNRTPLRHPGHTPLALRKGRGSSASGGEPRSLLSGSV